MGRLVYKGFSLAYFSVKIYIHVLKPTKTSQHHMNLQFALTKFVSLHKIIQSVRLAQLARSILPSSHKGLFPGSAEI